MNKSELRKTYLAKQKQLSSFERKEKSREIVNQFFQNFNLTQIKILHCFLPIERTGEIDTRLIFQKIWRDFPNITTLVPRVDFEINEIENLRFTPETEIKQNQWQIQEPTHNETIESEKIDAVLVPLLCFDEKGFRVGYGKGFYDKFLEKCRADCSKIGLSYFAPVAKIADSQKFDVKLDFCVAPKKIWNF